MSKVFIFTNIPPHYRVLLWETLLKSAQHCFHFYFGNDSQSRILPIDFTKGIFPDYKSRLRLVKNRKIGRKVLVWQDGVVSACLREKTDFAIFLGDMYCLSTWIAAIICRLRRTPVAFWGHGLYGNEGFFKNHFRVLFYQLANRHLLYERKAKQRMIDAGFNSKNLFVVFNSLNYNEHLYLRDQLQTLTKQDVFPFFKNSALPVIIFIGRLVKSKKLDMLINAVNSLNNNSEKVNLLIIGDGPESDSLKMLGFNGVNKGVIHFFGACYDELNTGRFIYHADLCVSPGSVGLTAIHSLSFGTPVFTHSSFENQMPEVEAIKEGETGFFFREDDLGDLTKGIVGWIEREIDRSVLRQKCYEVIDRYYNPTYQVSVFYRAIEGQIPEI